MNDALLAGVTLTPLDEMWVDASDRSRVHSFIIKPPNFTPARKYPVIFLIHGGPQGAWGESWTYRWNAQVFASAGYVVVQPNPRGSTGYGQKFIDEINGDWGGKPYDDIMAVVDAVGAQPYIDNQRMAVAGRVSIRLHGELDQRPHQPLQGHRLARRRVRPGELAA